MYNSPYYEDLNICIICNATCPEINHKDNSFKKKCKCRLASNGTTGEKAVDLNTVSSLCSSPQFLYAQPTAVADLARVASFSTETRFGSVGKVASSLESLPSNMHVICMQLLSPSMIFFYCKNFNSKHLRRLLDTSGPDICMVIHF